MGEMNALDVIAVTEAKSAVQLLPADASIEDKLRAAMRVTKDHYMLPRDEGRQLRAAVGAVMLVEGAESANGQRLAAEHRQLGTISAMLRAAEAGLVIDGSSVPEPLENPIGILGLWKSL